MVVGLTLYINRPRERETLDKMVDILNIAVKNETSKTYEIKVYAKFYFSNDKINWITPSTIKYGSSIHSSKPGEYAHWITGIFLPKTEFEKYHYLKIYVQYTIKSNGNTIETFTETKIVEHVDSIPPKKPPSTYVPLDKIQAWVVNYIKQRNLWYEIDYNRFLIDVSDTVRKVDSTIQGAWLVIDVSIPNMKVETGWALTEEENKPKAIVRRWLNGIEVERLTVDGIKYTATMPCSVLIALSNGHIQHGGKVLNATKMLEILRFHGLLEGIAFWYNPPSDDKPISDTDEEVEDEEAEDEQKKDKTLILLAAILGVSFIIIAFRGLRR